MSKILRTITKVSVSILGACNVVMDLFIPIAVALLLLAIGGASIDKLNSIIIIGVALGASIFRGIKPWLK